MSQYSVPGQFGMVDIDEGNGGDQYMVYGGVDIDEPPANSGSFFLMFDIAWIIAALFLIGLAANS